MHKESGRAQTRPSSPRLGLEQLVALRKEREWLDRDRCFRNGRGKPVETATSKTASQSYFCASILGNEELIESFRHRRRVVRVRLRDYNRRHMKRPLHR